MRFKKPLTMLLAGGVLALTGCCMDDMSCGGSNSYVPVSSCNTCSSPSTYTCNAPRVSRCCNSCNVCGYVGSYAYTSWY